MRPIIAFIIITMAFLPVFAWGKIGGGDIVFRPSGANTVVYSHDAHVGRIGLKCVECHPKIFVMAAGYGKTKMASMEAGQACGACHNGTKAFAIKTNCAKCHVP